MHALTSPGPADGPPWGLIIAMIGASPDRPWVWALLWRKR